MPHRAYPPACLPSLPACLQAKHAAWDQWSATVAWPKRTMQATKVGGWLSWRVGLLDGWVDGWVLGLRHRLPVLLLLATVRFWICQPD